MKSIKFLFCLNFLLFFFLNCTDVCFLSQPSFAAFFFFLKIIQNWLVVTRKQTYIWYEKGYFIITFITYLIKTCLTKLIHSKKLHVQVLHVESMWLKQILSNEKIYNCIMFILLIPNRQKKILKRMFKKGFLTQLNYYYFKVNI